MKREATVHSQDPPASPRACWRSCCFLLCCGDRKLSLDPNTCTLAW